MKRYLKKDLSERWRKSYQSIGRYVRDEILARPAYIGNTAFWTEEQVLAAEEKLIKSTPTQATRIEDNIQSDIAA